MGKKPKKEITRVNSNKSIKAFNIKTTIPKSVCEYMDLDEDSFISWKVNKEGQVYIEKIQ